MKYPIITLFILIFILPTTAQTRKEKKSIKKETERKQYEATKSIIASGFYYFKPDIVTSLGGHVKEIYSENSFLKIDKGMANISLPYFGNTQSIVVGFRGVLAITYKGEIENYRVKINAKKQKTTIKFSATGDSDHFDFTIIVYKSRSANVNVTSNHRSAITYDGYVHLGVPSDSTAKIE